VRPRPTSVAIRLAAALAGTMCALFGLEQSAQFQSLLEPINLGLARAVEFVLRQLEIPVARQGPVLAHPDGFSYRIAYVCSGLRPAALIAVTLLVAPATWRARIVGLGAALAGIEALNLLRLVHLYWTGVVDPDAFFVAHRIVWNAIAIVATIGFLGIWLRTADPDPAHTSDGEARETR